MKTRSEHEKQIFLHKNYAHRGLYSKDQSIPENSLPAFKAAAGAGYGVELDVQLSKDGHVMVFHDDSLKRMCGKDGNIWDYTLDELRGFSLAGTGERIPLFSEALEALKENAGPLIVELKTGPKNQELAYKTYTLLKSYPRDYCIESFNPFIVDWFRKNAPEVFRGQLASAPDAYRGYPSPIARFLSSCRYSGVNKPDFIAYNHETEIPKHVKMLRDKGTLLIAWTSRDEAKASETEQAFDAVIFEHYKPKPAY